MALYLSLAGFDPSGGAGLLADTQVWQQLGHQAMALSTAQTVQNSKGVTGLVPGDPSLFEAQFKALAQDFKLDGFKIGLLANAAMVELVTRLLLPYKTPKILDPVLKASSGAQLLDAAGTEAMLIHLLPQVDLLTPNLAEAAQLTGQEVQNLDQMELAAHALLKRGARRVLIKGGHLAGEPVDLYVDLHQTLPIGGPRASGLDPRGTGCLLSSAILGHFEGDWPQAVQKAKAYAYKAIARSQPLGAGQPYWKLS